MPRQNWNTKVNIFFYSQKPVLFHNKNSIFAPHRDVAQLVACFVRDEEAAGSSPVIPTNATLAQLVEQLTRNEQVVGSSPMSGSKTGTGIIRTETCI